MNHQHPSNATTCGLCWLGVPHDAEAHHQALAARYSHSRALISEYHDRMRLANRWQPLVSAMDAAALDAFGSWLIDEAADLAWSADESGRWLNGQLQRMVADEQERRADLAGAARSAAA
jgi:hypothetical protein